MSILLYIKIAAFLVITSGLSYLGYKFYTLDRLNKEQEKTIAVLSTSLSTNEKVIEYLKEGIVEDNERMDTLFSKLDAASKQEAKANRVIDSHDLENIVKAKPKMVNDRMLNATNKLFNDFEVESRK